MGKLYNRQSVLHKRRYLRHNSTLAEKRLWQYLRKSQLGYKFRRQHSIGPYITDFYCPALRLVVEVDGDSHFSDEAQRYDLIREQYMNNANINTIRVTNQEVLHCIDIALERIKQASPLLTKEGSGVVFGHL